MFCRNWSRRLANLKSTIEKQTRWRRNAARQRGMRPVVEALETRTLLSTLFSSSFGRKSGNVVNVDGWVESEGSDPRKSDCSIDHHDSRSGGASPSKPV